MDKKLLAGILGLLLAAPMDGVSGENAPEDTMTLASAVAAPEDRPAMADPKAPASGASVQADRNLELGGLVTLDHEAGLSGSEDPSLGLGEVALGANVALTGDILASVVLMAEGDLEHIFFDQAMAEVKPEGGRWTFLFGQQTYNHGLLSTRLISDPEILNWLEVKHPGLGALFNWSGLTAGAALTLIESELGDTQSHDYAFIPNLDWSHGPVETRVSALFSQYRSDVDGAASLAWGPARIDAEGFLQFPLWDGEERLGGYLLGLEIGLGERLSVAYRQDGITGADLQGLPVVRHGIGASFTLKQDLFAAIEYSDGRGGENPGRRLAMQLGLKSTLNLPGFQRATLTQD